MPSSSAPQDGSRKTVPREIVTANRDVLRYPMLALRMSAATMKDVEGTQPGNWDNGFVLVRSPVIPGTRLVKKYQLAQRPALTVPASFRPAAVHGALLDHARRVS
jgi:hypothetical protein